MHLANSEVSQNCLCAIKKICYINVNFLLIHMCAHMFKISNPAVKAQVIFNEVGNTP